MPTEEKKETPKETIKAPMSHPPEDKKFEPPKADITPPDIKEKEPTKSLVSKALKHADEIKAFVLKFHGKHGYNPYSYLKDSGIDDGVEILKNDNESETSRIIAERIITLPIVEPVIKPMKPTGLREFLAKQEAERELKKNR